MRLSLWTACVLSLTVYVAGGDKDSHNPPALTTTLSDIDTSSTSATPPDVVNLFHERAFPDIEADIVEETSTSIGTSTITLGVDEMGHTTTSCSTYSTIITNALTRTRITHSDHPHSFTIIVVDNPLDASTGATGTDAGNTDAGNTGAGPVPVQTGTTYTTVITSDPPTISGTSISTGITDPSLETGTATGAVHTSSPPEAGGASTSDTVTVTVTITISGTDTLSTLPLVETGTSSGPSSASSGGPSATTTSTVTVTDVPSPEPSAESTIPTDTAVSDSDSVSSAPVLTTPTSSQAPDSIQSPPASVSSTTVIDDSSETSPVFISTTDLGNTSIQSPPSDISTTVLENSTTEGIPAASPTSTEDGASTQPAPVSISSTPAVGTGSTGPIPVSTGENTNTQPAPSPIPSTSAVEGGSTGPIPVVTSSTVSDGNTSLAPVPVNTASGSGSSVPVPVPVGTSSTSSENSIQSPAPISSSTSEPSSVTTTTTTDNVDSSTEPIPVVISSSSTSENDTQSPAPVSSPTTEPSSVTTTTDNVDSTEPTPEAATTSDTVTTTDADSTDPESTTFTTPEPATTEAPTETTVIISDEDVITSSLSHISAEFRSLLPLFISWEEDPTPPHQTHIINGKDDIKGIDGIKVDLDDLIKKTGKTTAPGCSGKRKRGLFDTLFDVTGGAVDTALNALRCIADQVDGIKPKIEGNDIKGVKNSLDTLIDQTIPPPGGTSNNNGDSDNGNNDNEDENDDDDEETSSTSSTTASSTSTTSTCTDVTAHQVTVVCEPTAFVSDGTTVSTTACSPTATATTTGCSVTDFTTTIPSTCEDETAHIVTVHCEPTSAVYDGSTVSSTTCSPTTTLTTTGCSVTDTTTTVSSTPTPTSFPLCEKDKCGDSCPIAGTGGWVNGGSIDCAHLSTSTVDIIPTGVTVHLSDSANAHKTRDLAKRVTDPDPLPEFTPAQHQNGYDTLRYLFNIVNFLHQQNTFFPWRDDHVVGHWYPFHPQGKSYAGMMAQTGCSSMYIVTRFGAYMGHFTEKPIFVLQAEDGAVIDSDEKTFQYNVFHKMAHEWGGDIAVDPVENFMGTDEEPGPLHRSFEPKVFIISPIKEGHGQGGPLQYQERIDWMADQWARFLYGDDYAQDQKSFVVGYEAIREQADQLSSPQRAVQGSSILEATPIQYWVQAGTIQAAIGRWRLWISGKQALYIDFTNPDAGGNAPAERRDLLGRDIAPVCPVSSLSTTSTPTTFITTTRSSSSSTSTTSTTASETPTDTLPPNWTMPTTTHTRPTDGPLLPGVDYSETTTSTKTAFGPLPLPSDTTIGPVHCYKGEEQETHPAIDEPILNNLESYCFNNLPKDQLGLASANDETVRFDAVSDSKSDIFYTVKVRVSWSGECDGRPQNVARPTLGMSCGDIIKEIFKWDQCGGKHFGFGGWMTVGCLKYQAFVDGADDQSEGFLAGSFETPVEESDDVEESEPEPEPESEPEPEPPVPKPDDGQFDGEGTLDPHDVGKPEDYDHYNG
ncbi:hypothetical protein BJY04DRAFT_223316 [Aspergillus karnatakaensis]|uniref:uncharacterized protein n=1 Tax=Aspergillus karnatakaensis TaxID=1810916 RepID=UPI003CCD2791